MKIISIETFLREDRLAIVRVRTDTGAEGYGQTAPYAADLSVAVLHRLVAPAFVGTDPWDVEVIGRAVLRQHYKMHGSFIKRALCGVDTAIWDLLARSVDLPVYKLIGGEQRASVPVYGSSMSRAVTPEEEADRMIAAREEQGFGAFKLRIGDGLGEDRDAWPGRTEQIISTVRDRLGDSVELMADANGAYTAARAIEVGHLLEDHRYFHFEEPCPFWDIESTARVAAGLIIQVAGGEQDHSLPQFRRILDLQAVDIIQPDIGYLGGVSRARQVARMAEAAGIPCTPHCANASMIRIFSLHLAAAMPSVHQYQEWTIERDDWTAEIFDPLPRVREGRVDIPTGVGWGVTISPSFLKNAEQQTTTGVGPR